MTVSAIQLSFGHTFITILSLFSLLIILWTQTFEKIHVSTKNTLFLFLGKICLFISNLPPLITFTLIITDLRKSFTRWQEIQNRFWRFSRNYLIVKILSSFHWSSKCIPQTINYCVALKSIIFLVEFLIIVFVLSS